MSRILLVDDNVTNLDILYHALEKEGYELLVATSGDEALSISRDATPAVVLLDINMPGLDGFETCRRMKDIPGMADAAIIFLSARSAVDDKILGLGLGAVDYITKPFQFEEVVARVRTHIDTLEHNRELKRRNDALEAKLAAAPATLTFPPDSGQIASLIAGGENDTVEFKSTLRWNLFRNKPDRKIENASLKTIAAFLNSDGGTLLVGVDDDGAPLGLDSDDFSSEDRLLLHLNTLVTNHLGGEFASFARSTIVTVQDKRVLAVICRPSFDPVFFRRDNDEIFYVRSGPSTRQLKPSEVLAYVKNRGA